MICCYNTADLNPIGGISKTDLKKFISYARHAFDLPVLDRLDTPVVQFQRKSLFFDSFINATPTAELEPITADYVQADEVPLYLLPINYLFDICVPRPTWA